MLKISVTQLTGKIILMAIFISMGLTIDFQTQAEAQAPGFWGPQSGYAMNQDMGAYQAGSGQYMLNAPCPYNRGGGRWGGFDKDDASDARLASVRSKREKLTGAKNKLDKELSAKLERLQDILGDLAPHLQGEDASTFADELVACQKEFASQQGTVSEAKMRSEHSELGENFIKRCEQATKGRSWSATTTVTTTTTTDVTETETKAIENSVKTVIDQQIAKSVEEGKPLLDEKGRPWMCYQEDLGVCGIDAFLNRAHLTDKTPSKDRLETQSKLDKIKKQRITYVTERRIEETRQNKLKSSGGSGNSNKFEAKNFCIANGPYSNVEAEPADLTACQNKAAVILSLSKEVLAKEKQLRLASKRADDSSAEFNRIKNVIAKEREEKIAKGEYDPRYEGDASGYGCTDPECQARKREVEEHPYLKTFAPIGVAAGFGIASAMMERYRNNKNAQAGWASGPSYSLPMIFQGYYGSVMGGQGHGGFGCSPTINSAFNGGGRFGGFQGNGPAYGPGYYGGMMPQPGFAGGGMYTPGWGPNTSPYGFGGFTNYGGPGMAGGMNAGFGPGYGPAFGPGYGGGFGPGAYGAGAFGGGGFAQGAYRPGIGPGYGPGFGGGGISAGFNAGFGPGYGGGGGMPGYGAYPGYGANGAPNAGFGGGFGPGYAGVPGYGGVGGGAGGYGGFGGAGGYNYQAQLAASQQDLTNNMMRYQNINQQIGQLAGMQNSIVNPGVGGAYGAGGGAYGGGAYGGGNYGAGAGNFGVTGAYGNYGTGYNGYMSGGISGGLNYYQGTSAYPGR